MYIRLDFMVTVLLFNSGKPDELAVLAIVQVVHGYRIPINQENDEWQGIKFDQQVGMEGLWAAAQSIWVRL